MMLTVYRLPCTICKSQPDPLTGDYPNIVNTETNLTLCLNCIEEFNQAATTAIDNDVPARPLYGSGVTYRELH